MAWNSTKDLWYAFAWVGIWNFLQGWLHPWSGDICWLFIFWVWPKSQLLLTISSQLIARWKLMLMINYTRSMSQRICLIPRTFFRPANVPSSPLYHSDNKDDACETHTPSLVREVPPPIPQNFQEDSINNYLEQPISKNLTINFPYFVPRNIWEF